MIPLIRARVDTRALRANLELLRQRAPGTRVMAVIKANAYGHGLVSTALALPDADAFAVARVDEAVQLRASGIRQPIVLLEGVINQEQLLEAARLGLELVVHEPGQLAMLEDYRGAQRLALWLKVDTGMNRLGFRPEAFAAAYARLCALRQPPQALRILTHLARAEEADPAPSRAQLARLLGLTAGMDAELSVANSAATLSLPDTHRQWIRPGLALYGVSPFAGRTGSALGLHPVMTLQSVVIAVRELPTGECVGYGANWRAARPSRIAIVAGGYGDGLLRSLPSSAEVLVAGRRAPLAGRVSMDMIAVDVTGLPPVSVGDEVELWGSRLPVEALANAAGTIPYELLCGVSRRVPLELT